MPKLTIDLALDLGAIIHVGVGVAVASLRLLQALLLSALIPLTAATATASTSVIAASSGVDGDWEDVVVLLM